MLVKVTETSIWASDKPDKNRALAGVTFGANVRSQPERIRCKECQYARVDPSACEYTKRICKRCECCENPKKCEHREKDAACPGQKIVWTAYECVNFESEYHKALLNVTPNGDMQQVITWSGCEQGARRAKNARNERQD